MTNRRSHNTDFLILGAGKPYQGAEHPTLVQSHHNTRVLDWIISAVVEHVHKINFVCGYQAETISLHYPDFVYIYNDQWEVTSSAYSFLLYPPIETRSLLVTYSDIVFHKSAVDEISAIDADIVLAYDSQWQRRFHGRAEGDLARCEKVTMASGRVTRLGADIDVDFADGEFVGLVKFSQSVCRHLKSFSGELLKRFAKARMSDLIEYFRIQGFDVQGVDLYGNWAELNEPQDLTHFILGTKAQTLLRLRPLVNHSTIQEQVSFTVHQWKDRQEILSRVESAFRAHKVVVRSSALSEDGFASANAGAYTSVLDVDASNKSALQEAILSVIASYPDGNENNQVLIQPMVSDVIASGVAFTRSLAHGAPYYVINYDDITLSTESITSGHSKEHKTLLVHRGSAVNDAVLPEVLSNLLPALREVEQLLHFDSLDIEFAISSDCRVHVLQVRPIAVDHSQLDITDEQVAQQIVLGKEQFLRLQRSRPFVLGQRAIFGVMPDWNPAEIIGTKPGRLASSLYLYLIMDSIWATQRAEYGYRDVRPQPLLTLFAGLPYVDVRASFNSFVPAILDEALAGRLVDFYLQWLYDHPHLHDKVEFDVVPTCYGLDFSRWRERLTIHGGFSDQEVTALQNALKEITLTALKRNDTDNASVTLLQNRFERIMGQRLAPLELMACLLEDCRQYGTLAFSHLARSAFIAVTLLRSAVEENIISQSAADAFLNSIRTVTHHFTEDAVATACGQLAWNKFVLRYGHLRPGTYDINSPSYRDDPERFLRPIVERAATVANDESDDFSLWLSAREDFVKALNQRGFQVTVDSIETFMRGAIEGREYAKFAFTRNLSAALDALREFGESLGIKREQLADIPLDAFLALQTGKAAPLDTVFWLTSQAEEGQNARNLASFVELPPLLTCEQDFDCFLYPGSQANFVGSSRVIAESVELAAQGSSEDLLLEGKIVLIPQADPGYDWLFGQGIAGLITMYGGANSHMAIRSAEFGLPAAIGVGEAEYQRLAVATALELDTGNRNIRVV